MIKGDEWIRSVFQFTGQQKLLKRDLTIMDNAVLTHLKNVEKDFLSLTTKIKKLRQRLLGT